jgi:hypothetical protein
VAGSEEGFEVVLGTQFPRQTQELVVLSVHFAIGTCLTHAYRFMMIMRLGGTCGMKDFSDLIELLRCRAMYGDDYRDDKLNLFEPDSWRGDYVLISAYHHVVNGIQYYGRSTAAIALGDSPDLDVEVAA